MAHKATAALTAAVPQYSPLPNTYVASRTYFKKNVTALSPEMHDMHYFYLSQPYKC